MTEVVPNGGGKPKRRANENPWYLLATLYGEKAGGVAKRKNRNAWNRYVAAMLSEEDRATLVASNLCSHDDLKPLPPNELADIERAFAKRNSLGASVKISDLPSDRIDLSNLEFEEDIFFQHRLFPVPTYFSGTNFSKGAWLENTIFLKGAYFDGTNLSEEVQFNKANFFEDAQFDNAVFSGRAYFEDVTFSKRAFFIGVTFSKEAWFDDCVIKGGAWFESASFRGLAVFDGARFSAPAYFDNVKFLADAQFESAIFTGAWFQNATFSRGAWFDEAVFRKDVWFNKATFHRTAWFYGATFSNSGSFENVNFESETSFHRAKFRSRAFFVNAKLRGVTSFTASFSRPPDLRGAALHEGTVLRGVDWPLPHRSDLADSFVDAYERLKLEMDRLKRHQDELDFFVLEMKSRQVLDRSWRRVPSLVYNILSEYGRSYLRPITGLIITIMLGMISFWGYFGLYELPYFGISKFMKPLGLSVSNTFGVFGFQKDYLAPRFLEGLPHLLKIVSGIQTVLGTVLLFLFGLALRNRFRMK